MQSWAEYDLIHQLNPDSLAATADVASPRPREVGGACRIQVLAIARTQETVGGPNGATRSEFRRGCPAVDVKRVLQATCANPAFLPPSSFALLLTGADRGFLPPSLEPRVQIRPFCPRHPIIDVVLHL